MTIEEMKREVCDWAKQSYDEKLFAGTSGNLSLYDGENMAITPTCVPYETMTSDDIVIIKLDGTMVEGKYQPSSEWRMHAAVYEAKPEVSAIIHTHSPYATAFAVNNSRIPTILIEMVPFLGGDVPLAKFAVPGTKEVGFEAVKVMEERTGCLLANHGVLTVGDSLTQAHIRAIYVEDAAKICSLALSNGDIVEIPEKYIAIMRGK